MPTSEAIVAQKRQVPTGEQARQPLSTRLMDGIRRWTGNPPALLLKAAGVRFMADPIQPAEPGREEKKSKLGPATEITTIGGDGNADKTTIVPIRSVTPTTNPSKKSQQ